MFFFDFVSLKRFGSVQFRELQTLQRWGPDEAFDPDWASRIMFMANFLEPGNSIIDLGCGPGWLKRYLPSDCLYYGCDAFVRDEKTIVCDFNKREFPNIFVDVSFVSGVLEYVSEWEWFIKSSLTYSKMIVMSYCSLDYFPDMKYRNELGWTSNLSLSTIIDIIEENGFLVMTQEQFKDNSTVIVAKRAKITAV